MESLGENMKGYVKRRKCSCSRLIISATYFILGRNRLPYSLGASSTRCDNRLCIRIEVVVDWISTSGHFDVTKYESLTRSVKTWIEWICDSLICTVHIIYISRNCIWFYPGFIGVLGAGTAYLGEDLSLNLRVCLCVYCRKNIAPVYCGRWRSEDNLFTIVHRTRPLLVHFLLIDSTYARIKLKTSAARLLNRW